SILGGEDDVIEKLSVGGHAPKIEKPGNAKEQFNRNRGCRALLAATVSGFHRELCTLKPSGFGHWRWRLSINRVVLALISATAPFHAELRPCGMPLFGVATTSYRVGCTITSDDRL